MSAPNPARPRRIGRILVLASAGIAVLVTFRSAFRNPHPISGATSMPTVAKTPDRSLVATPPMPALADTVLLRPLPVSLASPRHEWTAGNAMDPEVIGKIAHNPDEFIRMVGENERIERRQLVYRRETAATLVQRAMASGQVLKSLTLPGLDGRELEFEILHSDLSPTGEKGSFSGRLAGKPNSIVVLSFKGGREAFSVSSSDENLHLQADPREPGEIIVKSIDPKTYIQGGCGTLGHNH